MSLELKSDPKVAAVFSNYPGHVRTRMEHLRQLVLETAEEMENVSSLEETLKWGEPSYIAKKGSTLRMDWKVKTPNQFAMYFKCTSKLVPTFKKAFGNLFTYEGDRAIVFQLDQPLPEKELKECVKATLTYHSVKHLPSLGI